MLACNDDIDIGNDVLTSSITTNLLAGQPIMVVVSGYADWFGDYVLSITG